MSSAVGAFLTSSSLPGREVFVGEGDGGVAEHGADAGRLVLLGRGFAGRIPLFAQHRDRRVARGQLLGRGFAGSARDHLAADHDVPGRGGRCGQAEQGQGREERGEGELGEAAGAGGHPRERTSARRPRPVAAQVGSASAAPAAGSSSTCSSTLPPGIATSGDDEGDRHHGRHPVEDRARGEGEVVGDRGEQLSCAGCRRWWARLSQVAAEPWLTQSATSSAWCLGDALGAEAGLQVGLVLEDQDRAEHGEAEAGAEVPHRLGDPGRLAVAAARRPG